MRALICGVFFTFLITGCKDKGPDHPDEIGAYSYCTFAIKERLKSPSTADFAGYRNSNVVPGKAVNTGNGNLKQTFMVASYVDSQNSFGATIRTTFVCQMEGKTGGHWSVKNIVM
mgnify:CR=1 FL=1